MAMLVYQRVLWLFQVYPPFGRYMRLSENRVSQTPIDYHFHCQYGYLWVYHIFRQPTYHICWLHIPAYQHYGWLYKILDFCWLNTWLTIHNQHLSHMMNGDPTLIWLVIYHTISANMTSTRFIYKFYTIILYLIIHLYL